jgi:hypothetical protein
MLTQALPTQVQQNQSQKRKKFNPSTPVQSQKKQKTTKSKQSHSFKLAGDKFEPPKDWTKPYKQHLVHKEYVYSKIKKYTGKIELSLSLALYLFLSQVVNGRFVLKKTGLLKRPLPLPFLFPLPNSDC